jgi:hypothetical protein
MRPFHSLLRTEITADKERVAGVGVGGGGRGAGGGEGAGGGF